MTTAQEFYDKEFSDCPRSAEYKAGALRGCLLEAGDVHVRRTAHPYQDSPVKFDAYCYGIECGRRAYRAAAEFGELQ